MTTAMTSTIAITPVEAEIAQLGLVIRGWERRHRMLWIALDRQADESSLCGEFEDEAEDIPVPDSLPCGETLYTFPYPIRRRDLVHGVSQVAVTARIRVTVRIEDLFPGAGVSSATGLEYSADLTFDRPVESIDGLCPCATVHWPELIRGHLMSRAPLLADATVVEVVSVHCDAADHESPAS